jgi:hypothetical protein
VSSAFPAVDKSLKLQQSFLGKAHAEDVTEHYEIGKVLGAGNYGTTRIAVHKPTGEVFACKSIMKSRCAAARGSMCSTSVCCCPCRTVEHSRRRSDCAFSNSCGSL